MYVISRNYRDRQSPNKWLVRKEEEPLSSAIECTFVEATDVRFTASSQGEDGFGCKVVALAKECSFKVVKTSQALHFNGRFFMDEENDVITSVDKLTLSEDGKMTAVF